MSEKTAPYPVSMDLRGQPLGSIMRTDVVSVGMDETLGKAIELCSERKIRHLPVLDESGRLAGLVTDRDLRSCVSPRIGTISENNADRDTLRRHIHVIMTRDLVTGTPEMTLADAARLMLRKRVGCLPVVRRNQRLAGMVTTSDFLRIIAQYDGQR